MHRYSKATEETIALRLPNQVAPVIRSNGAGRLDNMKGVDPSQLEDLDFDEMEDDEGDVY